MMTEGRTGVILDVDGTLWDSSYKVAEAWDAVFTRHPEVGRRCTRDDIMRVMGKPMDEIARTFFGHLSEEKRKRYARECEAYEVEYLGTHLPEVYPGVKETLMELAGEYALFIVSNCQVGYIELVIRAAEAEEWIRDYICWGDNEKPKGENIREIARRNGLERYYYVGDIQADYDATMDGGGRFIHAAYGFGTIAQEVPAIKEIRELPALMRKLEGAEDER